MTYKERTKAILEKRRPTMTSRLVKRKKKPIPTGLDPAVVFIIDEIHRQQASEELVALRAGCSKDYVSMLRQPRRAGKYKGWITSPGLQKIRAILNVLGFDLSVVQKDNQEYPKSPA